MKFNLHLPTRQTLKVFKAFRVSPKREWLAIVFLVCATLAFFWRVVFLGQVMLPADMIYTEEPWKSELHEQPLAEIWNPNLTDQIWQMYPIASYAMRARQNGGLLWDPHMMGGMPALARGDLFSNPLFHLFNSLMPVAAALSWVALCNVFLASIFTYLLLRQMDAGWFGALIASLAFAYGGYLIGWLSLTHITSGMVWLPLIFWAFERAVSRQNWRWAIVGSFAFLLHVLAGYILWAFYGAITLLLWSFYRGLLQWLEQKKLACAFKPVLYAGLILGIGSLLAAPQLLLTVQLYFNTARNEQIGATGYLEIAGHVVRLLVPVLYGNDVHGNTYRGPLNYPETTLYWGILPLIFIPASWWGHNRKLGWGMSVLGLASLLAVYNISPFRQIISLVYPVFLNVFPGRIFYLVSFTGSVAAGLGAGWLSERSNPKALKYFSLFSALLAAILVIFWNATTRDPLAQPANDLSSLRASIALLVTCSSLLGIYGIGWIKQPWFKMIALAITLFDLFWVGINYNATFDPETVFPETPSLRYLASLSKNENEPYRILNVNSGVILLGMTPEIYQFYTVSGYSSWVLKRFSEYTYLTGDRFTEFLHVYFIDCCDRLTDALNVKYIYTSPGTIPTSLGTLRLIENLAGAKIDTQFPNGVGGMAWAIAGKTENVLFQHPPSEIDFEFKLDTSATFKTAAYIDPQAWNQPGDGVLFEIFISRGNQEPETPVFSRYLNPKQNQADRLPVPVVIDLGPYLGQKIHLKLVTGPGPDNDVRYDWAGWVNPYIESSAPPPLRLVYDGPNKVYENRNAMPRAWIVHQVAQVPIKDFQAVKRKLRDPNFDLKTRAVIEVDNPAKPVVRYAPKMDYAEEAQIMRYHPERVEIAVNLQEAGLLVLADTYYPGWKVYIDGYEGQIVPTNLVMRGVILSQGQHYVEFIYRPDLLWIGLAVAGFTLLGLTVILIKG